MPRHYFRTTGRGNYGLERLQEAVLKVRSGEYSGYHAAIKYNVPRSTLMDRVSGRHGKKSASLGKPKAISTPIEEKLANTLKFMHQRGFHPGQKELLEMIGDYLAENSVIAFKSGKPGLCWLKSFMERYKLENSTKYKAEDDILNQYFCVLKDTIESLGFSRHPEKIWSFKETFFKISGDGCYILDTSMNANATVVTACNAAGDKAPILIVLKDNARISNGNISHASTENGKLDREIFNTYFTDTFLEDLSPPILVIYNGQASCIDIKLIEDSKDTGVVFMRSPPFFGDVTDFLKVKWIKDLKPVTNEDKFIAVLERGYREFTEEQIKLGFMNAGIHPFDSTACGADFPRAWGIYQESKCVIASKDDERTGGYVSSEYGNLDVASPETVVIKEEAHDSDESSNDNLRIVIEEVATAGASKTSENIRDSFDAAPKAVPSSRSLLKPDVKQPAAAPSASDASLLRNVRASQNRQAPQLLGPSYGGIIDAARTVKTPTRVCSVFGCQNNEREHTTKGFYPFPADEKLRAQWLQLTNRPDLTDALKARDARVCSDHFALAEHASGTLSAGAVPSRLLPRKRVAIVYAPDPNASGFLPATTSTIKTEPVSSVPEVTEVEIQFDPEEIPKKTYNPQVRPANAAPVRCVPQSSNGLRTMVIEPLPMLQRRLSQSNTTLGNMSIVKMEHDDQDNTRPSIVQVHNNRVSQLLKKADISPVEQIDIAPAPTPSTKVVRPVVEKKSVVTQTTKNLIDHMNLPMKRKYEGEIREANSKVRKLERQLANPKLTKKVFMEYCDVFLDEKIANIVKTHAYLINKHVGNRYGSEFKTFALNLYLCSPQSYKFVEQIFFLPSITTIKRFQMPIRTGVNQGLIDSFKVKVSEMSEKERISVMCFDYIGVNKNLYYDIGNDHLCGMHEIDQVLGPEPAQYAVLLMVRGLYSKWTQPISFAFVAEKISYPALKDWVLKIAALLMDIGLNVKALVTDMDTELLDLSDVSATEPYFEVNERKVYHVFDVPRLFRSARDEFMQYDLHCGSKVAKWAHFARVYEIDKEEELSLMPKVTEHHVRPTEETKDDVRIAAEVFSYTVVAVMNFHVKTNLVPKKTKDTVEFLTKMSRIYEFLMSQRTSSASRFLQRYRGTEEENQFLVETLEYLQTLELRDKEGHPVEGLNFVTGLIVTVKSIMSLSEDLKKENIPYILLKNLSKDCTSAYFLKVRQIAGVDYARPTAIMFARSFRKLFLRELMENTKEGGNHMDLKETLSKISEYVTSNSAKPETEQAGDGNVLLKVGVSDYQMVLAQSPTFISGFLMWKCLEKHHCQTLLENLANHYNLPANDEGAKVLIEKFQEYNGSNVNEEGLIAPPESLVQLVERMDAMYNDYYGTEGMEAYGFGLNLYKRMEEDTFDLTCACFPLRYLKFLFIRTKIYETVKEYNRTNRPKRRKR